MSRQAHRVPQRQGSPLEVLAEREAALLVREQELMRRQRAAELREQSLRAQAEALTLSATASAVTAAELREANERLVVATVAAQALTELAERATAQMAYLAKHDSLTGLPNRPLLIDRLAQSLSLAERHGRRVALMYLDLDHFKQINDTLGHTVGDQLLRSTAARLQSCVRLSDTVSRQGGDEFVVLLAEVRTVQDAAHTAEKLLKAMALPHLIDGHPLHVTISIGISLFPFDGTDVESMVRSADAAMYHAKKSGRANYKLFSLGMHSEGPDGTPPQR